MKCVYCEEEIIYVDEDDTVAIEDGAVYHAECYIVYGGDLEGDPVELDFSGDI